MNTIRNCRLQRKKTTSGFDYLTENRVKIEFKEFHPRDIFSAIIIFSKEIDFLQ
jgi:hypothetical protein